MFYLTGNASCKKPSCGIRTGKVRLGRVKIAYTGYPARLQTQSNKCRIHHVTVPIATRILIANVRQICVINLVYFKMQV